MNRKKLYRLYREEGLSVRADVAASARPEQGPPPALPQAPDQRWPLLLYTDRGSYCLFTTQEGGR